MGTSTNGILFYGFIQTEEGEGGWEEAHSRLWDDIDLALHFEKRTGLVFDIHCSNTSPLYYLAINDAHFLARRGYPETIDISKLTVNPEWEQKLRDYASSVGIDLSSQLAGWYLASYWG